MIGVKLNRTKKQKAQVLLIVVMLVATILSVIIANSFNSTTETQLTKLEEESQKAFAAAEAGIEAALKEGSVAIGELPGLEGYSGSANIEELSSENFTTPFLQKDEQYTLYLSTPNGAPENPDFTQLKEPYFDGSLTLCFSGDTTIEVTMIKNNNNLTRYIIKAPTSSIIIQGSDIVSANSGCPIPNFSYSYTFDYVSQTKLLIARLINNGSKLGFSASKSLPYQGKIITSKAISPAGVKKEVVFFQSYPQIPLEFFVTSF